MQVTLDRLGKWNDFKRCAECGAINWYENEDCHYCQNDIFDDFTKKEANKYIKEEVEAYQMDFPDVSTESILEFEVEV
jgi:thioredoxin-related protein